MSGWRPIESAPKDGSKILLAKIIPASEDRDAAIWWAVMGFWFHERRVARSLGQLTIRDHWTDGSEWLGEPTHWMPIPAPPNSKEK